MKVCTSAALRRLHLPGDMILRLRKHSIAFLTRKRYRKYSIYALENLLQNVRIDLTLFCPRIELLYSFIKRNGFILRIKTQLDVLERFQYLLFVQEAVRVPWALFTVYL